MGKETYKSIKQSKRKCEKDQLLDIEKVFAKNFLNRSELNNKSSPTSLY